MTARRQRVLKVEQALLSLLAALLPFFSFEQRVYFAYQCVLAAVEFILRPLEHLLDERDRVGISREIRCEEP